MKSSPRSSSSKMWPVAAAAAAVSSRELGRNADGCADVDAVVHKPVHRWSIQDRTGYLADLIWFRRRPASDLASVGRGPAEWLRACRSHAAPWTRLPSTPLCKALLVRVWPPPEHKLEHLSDLARALLRDFNDRSEHKPCRDRRLWITFLMRIFIRSTYLLYETMLSIPFLKVNNWFIIKRRKITSRND